VVNVSAASIAAHVRAELLERTRGSEEFANQGAHFFGPPCSSDGRPSGGAFGRGAARPVKPSGHLLSERVPVLGRWRIAFGQARRSTDWRRRPTDDDDRTARPVRQWLRPVVFCELAPDPDPSPAIRLARRRARLSGIEPLVLPWVIEGNVPPPRLQREDEKLLVRGWSAVHSRPRFRSRSECGRAKIVRLGQPFARDACREWFVFAEPYE
jgi:hypothetical protein